jgi:hypothetical protein
LCSFGWEEKEVLMWYLDRKGRIVVFIWMGKKGSVNVVFRQERKDCCVHLDGKKKKC